jgi:hypothetical protein
MSDDLRQADLSKLKESEMTDAQRAELRRRFQDFVKNVWANGRRAAAPKRAPRSVKAWVPTKRV